MKLAATQTSVQDAVDSWKAGYNPAGCGRELASVNDTLRMGHEVQQVDAEFLNRADRQSLANVLLYVLQVCALVAPVYGLNDRNRVHDSRLEGL